MEKKTRVLVSIICFLVGVILGIFLSPIKQGISTYCVSTNCCGKESKKEKQ